MKLTLTSFLLILIFSGCFKTAEEIKREKMIDQQLSQSSRIIAELSSQISELKGGLANTSGQLEEIDHTNKQNNELQTSTLNDTMTQLSEQIKVLTKTAYNNQLEIKRLNQEVQSQKVFIQKVTGTLSKIGGDTSSSSQGLLKQAHTAFEKNEQKKAQALYLRALNEQKMSNAKKNHVFYNLGLLKYWNKKYNDALIYFSKIYTKYPRSSFAPGALLYIGRSFKKQGKKDEARATFEELIKNYPKAKQVKLAHKELAS